MIQVKARLNSPKPSLNKYQLQFASLPLDAFGVVRAGGAGMLGVFGRGTCYSVLKKSFARYEGAAAGVGLGFTIQYDTTIAIASTWTRLPSIARRIAARPKGGIKWSKDDPFLAALRRCGPSREHVLW